MVHIISYEIVSSLKPDSLFTSESLPISKYYESLFHNYFNSKGKETIFHSSIVYQQKQQPKFPLMGGN